jgi:hypothetical protein
MPVLSRVEGSVVGNACNKGAVQVAHRLGQVESVAHLVGHVLKLGTEAEPPQSFDATIK